MLPVSAGLYIGRLWAFAAFSGIEFNLLAFFESSVPFRNNVRMMDKYLFAAVIRNDKTITFAFIEPFYCACTHLFTP